MASQSSSGMTRSVPTPSSTDILHRPDSFDETSQEGIYIKHPQADTNILSTSPSSSSNFDTFQPSSSPTNLRDPIPDRDANPTIILRPSFNNSIHQLSTLSHSNHTFSPYTRSLEHFTVRSVPPRVAGLSSNGAEKQPIKARRKRTHRLGGVKAPVESTILTPEAVDMPPAPPSEFDASDMDRYFRSRDDFIPPSAELDSTHHVHQQPRAPNKPFS